MMPKEIQEALRQLRKDVGPHADVYASVNISNPPLSINVYPQGICGGTPAIHAGAETWGDLFLNIREAWVNGQQEHHDRMIRNMALEIIRITDEQGECSDAALRGDTYLAEDIERYGEAACAKADEMAGRGPFEIVRMRGANAA